MDLVEYRIIPAFRLSPKHIKSIRLNQNISKYWEFGELKVLCLDTKSDMTSKYFSHFFIIRHYKLDDFELLRSVGCWPPPDFPRRNTFQQHW